MSDKKFSPKKIYLDRKSLGFPMTERILQITDTIPVQIVDSVSDAIADIPASGDPVTEGKKNLLITQHKGDFVKPCPCTPGYVGCNYFIVNLDINCPLDCSYCILQHYLTNPFITIHANRRKMWAELDGFLNKKKNKTIRIGTGELGDSLALDHLTGNSLEMISYFQAKPNTLFELKTKTANIEYVLSSSPSENIILSWSLNSEEMAGKEEKEAPSVQTRIAAARQVVDRGFRVGFHFDPLLYYPGWEEGYAAVVEDLFSLSPRSRIAWISLGSLRFSSVLKPIIQKRFPDSQILYEELIRGKDGKFRYFKPIRLEMYRRIIMDLKRGGGGRIPLYLCMESREMWQKVLQKKPRGKEDVEKSISLPLGVCR